LLGRVVLQALERLDRDVGADEDPLVRRPDEGGEAQRPLILAPGERELAVDEVDRAELRRSAVQDPASAATATMATTATRTIPFRPDPRTIDISFFMSVTDI